MDLDDEIVRAHALDCEGEQSPREILNAHGEAFFRELEHRVLETVLEAQEPRIVALGGGTPMMEQNRALTDGHRIVHITAPRSIIFERIMINGKPAFFPQEKDAFDHFQELWAERLPVFESIADITVNNEGSVDMLADNVLSELHLSPLHS